MPLQQIQLDQSIYNKQKPKWGAGRQPGRSPVSEALTPQPGGMTTEQRYAGNYVLDQMRAEEAKEAERKYNEKMMKMQHEQAIEKLKFATAAERDAQKQQTTMGNVVAQAQQQGAQKQQIEDNPEPAADEMWKFYLSLPEENQKMFIDQMFTPTAPGGTVSSGGRTIPVGGQKYNAIAQNWIDKGRVMFDNKGNITVHEPEREFEKATFEIVEKGGKVYKLNTATGVETLLGKKDEPEKTVAEIDKQANADANAKTKLDPNTKFEDNKYDSLVDAGVDPEAAEDWAKVETMPKDPSKTPWYTKVANWFENIGKAEVPSGYQRKGAGAGEPTFDEANVTALVDILPDELSEAQRIDLVNQGASETDINEAVKRKKEGK